VRLRSELETEEARRLSPGAILKIEQRLNGLADAVANVIFCRAETRGVPTNGLNSRDLRHPHVTTYSYAAPSHGALRAAPQPTRRRGQRVLRSVIELTPSRAPPRATRLFRQWSHRGADRRPAHPFADYARSARRGAAAAAASGGADSRLGDGARRRRGVKIARRPVAGAFLVCRASHPLLERSQPMRAKTLRRDGRFSKRRSR